MLAQWDQGSETGEEANLGSMFEVSYLVKFKNDNTEKEFIDAVRVRNGNLPIVCAKVSAGAEEL